MNLNIFISALVRELMVSGMRTYGYRYVGSWTQTAGTW